MTSLITMCVKISLDDRIECSFKRLYLFWIYWTVRVLRRKKQVIIFLKILRNFNVYVYMNLSEKNKKEKNVNVLNVDIFKIILVLWTFSILRPLTTFKRYETMCVNVSLNTTRRIYVDVFNNLMSKTALNS